MVNANLGRLTAIAKSYAERESHEDLLQEILYHLWRSFPSFAGKSQLNTWVYKVALNTAITGLRSARYSHSVSFSVILQTAGR
jgi:RNA polymerase sigma-70 factor (ECF subfamily)